VLGWFSIVQQKWQPHFFQLEANGDTWQICNGKPIRKIMKWQGKIVQPFLGPSIKSHDKLFSKIHIKKNYKREGVQLKRSFG